MKEAVCSYVWSESYCRTTWRHISKHSTPKWPRWGSAVPNKTYGLSLRNDFRGIEVGDTGNTSKDKYGWYFRKLFINQTNPRAWNCPLLCTRNTKLNSMVWVRERTTPTERPPLVDEVIANFLRMPRGQRDGSYGRILGFLDRSRYFSIK
jgi:hypothetical protein